MDTGRLPDAVFCGVAERQRRRWGINIDVRINTDGNHELGEWISASLEQSNWGRSVYRSYGRGDDRVRTLSRSTQELRTPSGRREETVREHKLHYSIDSLHSTKYWHSGLRVINTLLFSFSFT